MDPITIASIGLGLYKAGSGIVKNIKGKKIAKRNIRPDYEIPEEYKDIVSMYQTLAQGGFGDDDLSRLNNKALQGLSASLSTGLRLGGDPNAVGDYYSRYLDNADDIAVKNTQLQFQNINFLANAKKDYADQKIVEFGYDKDAPYKDKAQLASAMRKEGTQDTLSGLDYALGSILQGQSRDLYQSYIDKMGVNSNAPSTTTAPAKFSLPFTQIQNPTLSNKSVTSNTDELEAMLDGMSEEERNMFLSGYFNK